METFSALLVICAGNSLFPGEFPAQRPVTQSFDIFFICVWINGWVNNREAGDLRRHRAHYDVTVMQCPHGTGDRFLPFKTMFCPHDWDLGFNTKYARETYHAFLSSCYLAYPWMYKGQGHMHSGVKRKVGLWICYLFSIFVCRISNHWLKERSRVVRHGIIDAWFNRAWIMMG